MILKNMMLREGSPSAKATSCMIPIRCHSGKGTTMETVNRAVVARMGEGRDLNRDTAQGAFFRAVKPFCMTQ